MALSGKGFPVLYDEQPCLSLSRETNKHSWSAVEISPFDYDDDKME